MVQYDKLMRLNALIDAAPDPSFYKPEELEEAWLKWRRAVSEERKAADRRQTCLEALNVHQAKEITRLRNAMSYALGRIIRGDAIQARLTLQLELSIGSEPDVEDD